VVVEVLAETVDQLTAVALVEDHQRQYFIEI
jgi:hypothetical protein